MNKKYRFIYKIETIWLKINKFTNINSQIYSCFHLAFSLTNTYNELEKYIFCKIA